MNEAAKKMFKELAAPFDVRLVKFRVGPKGRNGTAMPFAYIDAREVMERLDQACGPENWQDEVIINGMTVVSRISVRVPGEENTWVVKSDGADIPSGQGRVDDGAKTGISNAFKRAAVKLGIGRYLYWTPDIYYPVDQYGFSDQTLRKIAEDFSDWQRDFFGEDVKPEEGPQKPDNPKKPEHLTSDPREVDRLYEEFVTTMKRANLERAGEKMPQIKGADIIECLRRMNYRITTDQITAWPQVKQYGADALRDLIREIDSRPTLLNNEIPF